MASPLRSDWPRQRYRRIMGEVAVHQWQANIYTRSFIDNNGDGVSNVDGQGNPTEPGLALVATNIRFRDGSFSNFNNTDLNGYAGFNEVFPLFNWYVIETDTTRYKTTGVHVVYDAGGPADGTRPVAELQRSATNLANTHRAEFLCRPTCSVCRARSIAPSHCRLLRSLAGTPTSSASHPPAESIRPSGLVLTAGRDSRARTGSSNSARSHSRRARTAASMVTSCTPRRGRLTIRNCFSNSAGSRLVPHVKLNLYKEDVAADGVTQTLTLVDHTETSSFDDWAQGFRSDGVAQHELPRPNHAPT